MSQELERYSQTGFSTGEPDARDGPRCSVDSVFKERQQCSLSTLISTFSLSLLLLFSRVIEPCLSCSDWLSANPLRVRLTQKLMRLGHCRLLFPSLYPVLPFIYLSLETNLCMFVQAHTQDIQGYFFSLLFNNYFLLIWQFASEIKGLLS